MPLRTHTPSGTLWSKFFKRCKCSTAPPKCTNECGIAKRNAKLADALGITPESREKVSAVSYHEELVASAKSNHKFLGVVEKALAEYVTPLE